MHLIRFDLELVEGVDSAKSLLILWNLVLSWPYQAPELIDGSEFERHLCLIDSFDIVAQQMVVGDTVELLLEELLCRLPLIQVVQLPVPWQDLIVDPAEIFIVAFSL